jgi:uncharacterized protein
MTNANAIPNATFNVALIGMGEVLHQRLTPVRHGFRYGVFFLMLPMRSLHKSLAIRNHWWLAYNRFGLLSFHDADHGSDKINGLAWLDELLASQGITDADGEVWLQCFPRVLGYVFKPVSFWFCHQADGRLRCVVVEVNNTFGERHVYLLDESRPLRWGETLTARKQFHVSPFCAVQGLYRFRLLRTQSHEADRLVARIDYDAPTADTTINAPLLQTSLSGQLAPATLSRVLHAFITHPLMSFAVVGRIHWHALKLWIKRVPFHAKPKSPDRFITLSD